MIKIILFILTCYFSIAVTPSKFKFLIDFSFCPGCTDLSIINEANNLKLKFPDIPIEILVIASDRKELIPISKKFKNLDLIHDSLNLIKNNYNISEFPSLILVDVDDNILFSSINILTNKVDYRKLNMTLRLLKSTKLVESDDSFMLNILSGYESNSLSELCLLDYNNFKLNIFEVLSGKLLKSIDLPSNIPEIFKSNFSNNEWEMYYKDSQTQGIKLQNCFYDDFDNIILTGFCVGGVEIGQSIQVINDKEQSVKMYNGVPKSFYLKIKSDSIYIDSLSNNNLIELKSLHYKDSCFISSLLPINDDPEKQDSTYLLKIVNYITKEETPLININYLEKNNIKYRKDFQNKLQYLNHFDYKENLLVYINSFNNLAFCKIDNQLISIKPEGVLKKTFMKDLEYSTKSYYDAAAVNNFNNYFINSITISNDNLFYINLFKFKNGEYQKLVIQKYHVINGFEKEVVIELTNLNDNIINIAPVKFQSHKILTKWQKGRWKIIDLSEFID